MADLRAVRVPAEEVDVGPRPITPTFFSDRAEMIR